MLCRSFLMLFYFIMKKFQIILISFVVLVSGCNVESSSESFTLNRIIDGDTFVANNQKIRLWGIDTPERNQPYAQEATDFLQKLTSKGDLTCDYKDTDRYQRIVMRCFIDGEDIGSNLVENGLAKDFKKYSDGFYNREEVLAKSNNLGIWQ